MNDNDDERMCESTTMMKDEKAKRARSSGTEQQSPGQESDVTAAVRSDSGCQQMTAEIDNDDDAAVRQQQRHSTRGPSR